MRGLSRGLMGIVILSKIKLFKVFFYNLLKLIQSSFIWI